MSQQFLQTMADELFELVQQQEKNNSEAEKLFRGTKRGLIRARVLGHSLGLFIHGEPPIGLDSQARHLI